MEAVLIYHIIPGLIIVRFHGGSMALEITMEVVCILGLITPTPQSPFHRFKSTEVRTQNIQVSNSQEAARDQRILCASVVLDTKPDGIQQYLANAVYEACRTQSLKLAGFPDFSQYIQGLKDATPEVQINEYKVCVKRGSRLVVLGALAQQWLQSEQFKLEATNLIEAHNKKFNPDGDFVEEPEVRTICTKKSARAQNNSRGYQKIS